MDAATASTTAAITRNYMALGPRVRTEQLCELIRELLDLPAGPFLVLDNAAMEDILQEATAASHPTPATAGTRRDAARAALRAQVAHHESPGASCGRPERTVQYRLGRLDRVGLINQTWQWLRVLDRVTRSAICSSRCAGCKGASPWCTWLSAITERSPPMTKTTQEALICAYPGCENKPRPGEVGAGTKPKYCSLPDPVSGKPHTALTAFRRRQELARQGGGVAEPEDLGRPAAALWQPRRRRRADNQHRQRAEAHAEAAPSAAVEAGPLLTEALAATAAAERAAGAAREAAQGRVAEAGRAAENRVLAVQQERDLAVAGADHRAEEAESRARAAEQETARARQAAGSARAEPDRARDAADRQAQIREDATREQAELPAASETLATAAQDTRAEHTEAGLERARADRDQAARQAPRGATRRRRRSAGGRLDPRNQASPPGPPEQPSQ